MNERIKKLKEQATSYTWNGNDVTEELDEQKFAELIVGECIDYMNYRTKDWDAKLRWIFNDGSGYMDVDVDSLLKKHFGVEE